MVPRLFNLYSDTHLVWSLGFPGLLFRVFGSGGLHVYGFITAMQFMAFFMGSIPSG